MNNLTALAALLVDAYRALRLVAARANSAWQTEDVATSSVLPVHTRRARRDGVPVAVPLRTGIDAPPIALPVFATPAETISKEAHNSLSFRRTAPAYVAGVVIQGEHFDNFDHYLA
jgi:hypothetical protein